MTSPEDMNRVEIHPDSLVSSFNLAVLTGFSADFTGKPQLCKKIIRQVMLTLSQTTATVKA